MEELQNRLVIVLINLPKSKLRGLESFAMVMCASSEDGTTEMIDPPAGSKPGDVITVEGYDRTPDVEKQISKKKYKKVWEAVQVRPAYCCVRQSACRCQYWFAFAPGLVQHAYLYCCLCCP